MVGDPSGKDKMREMLTEDKIQENLKGFRPIFERFLDIDGVRICNNSDWLLGLNYISFLRDIGKHFSVNRMIKAEGTKQRLEREQGFSFIEFNYNFKYLMNVIAILISFFTLRLRALLLCKFPAR